MSAAPSPSSPRACPRCKGPILWTDGDPSPELILVVERGASKVVACGRCIGKRAAPEPTRLGIPAVDPPDRRPVRQIFAEEAPKVVGFLSDGLEIVDKVADLWAKLKPRKR